MKRIKNNTEMRNDLLDLYNGCRDGIVDDNQVANRTKTLTRFYVLLVLKWPTISLLELAKRLTSLKDDSCMDA